jgi:hypothetical protein
MGFGSLPRSDSLARLKREGVKRFHLWHFGKEPKEIDLSLRSEAEFEVSEFKEYEVQCQLMVRRDESDCSTIIGGFPTGTYVKILRMGSICSGEYHLKVTNKPGTLSGWVSSGPEAYRNLRKVGSKSKLRSNSMSQLASVSRRRDKRAVAFDFGFDSKTDLDLQPSKGLRIGDTLETKGKVVLREAESMSSAKVATVKGGSEMTVLDFGKLSNNRVKVSVNGTRGWITMLNTQSHEAFFAQRPHTF